MISKEDACRQIEQLVNRFDEQIDSYTKADYNETLTRRDFIDPFFKALGWDIDNEQGYAEAYREVIHEDKVKIGTPPKPRLFLSTARRQTTFLCRSKKAERRHQRRYSPGIPDPTLRMERKIARIHHH